MFGSSSNFIRLVEKSTSQLLLEPDWDSTLQICDAIRMSDVQANYALQLVKKKISQDNPHVSMFALHVLESVVKNCGSVIHEEIATKDFMEYLKDLVKKRPDPVKAKILELVQVWSHAFRNKASYKVVQDTFHLMKAEGFTFPQLKEADAMFSVERAPEWRDGECCHRCRVGFSTFQRKHHCRHCGNIFCNKCSSKNAIIPKFGLEREVRVCDSCYEEINAATNVKKEEGLPKEYLESSLSKQSQVNPKQLPPSKSEAELREEEELQLALAISMSEQTSKDSKKSRSGNTGTTTTSANEVIYAQPVKVTGMIDTSDMDPILAPYLNRELWEQKHEAIKRSTTQPSAPIDTIEAKSNTPNPAPEKVEEKLQNGEMNEDEEHILNALRSSVEIFVNRMRSNHARGRSIATDSSVQTLFMTINVMHPQLMKYLNNLDDARSYYESLQDKLAQLKDAREALDALRDEHSEKRRQEHEERERQRQIQMALKLDILRQKKQEYLEYQQQMALQRMQEQEREMSLRLEKQKQQQLSRALQYGTPQMYGQSNFSPAGSNEGSPHHQAHGQQTHGQPVSMGQYPTHMAPGAPGQVHPGQMGQMPPGSMPQGGMMPNQQIYSQPGHYPAGPVPGGYQQVPPGGYPGPNYGGAPNQYANSQPPSSQNVQGIGSGQEFQNFNMHNMANALPPQGHPQGQPISGNYGYMGNDQFAPPGSQQMAPQANPSVQNETLISFD